MAVNRNSLYILLLALFQALSSTFLLRIQNFSELNSILFLLSGALLSFLLVKVPEIALDRKAMVSSFGSFIWIKALLIAAFLPIGYHYCRQIMDDTPLAIENADMLPVIKVMGQRFLSGEWHSVYRPIPEIWNGLQPIYPSVLWMSFLPALLFDFDLRWITVIGIYLSAILCVFLLKFRKEAKFFSCVLLGAVAIV
ncbi:MAG TPA: hypothetical protein VF609_13820, partial [Flavisolibacter sp.]